MPQQNTNTVKINDLLVSRAGLGTVKFGRNQGVKYPAAFDLPDDKAVRHLLALAQELGINLLDTAPAYGSSEARLGKLLSNRHDWVICSKVGETFINRQSAFDFSAQAVRDSVYRSLKRLKTDYLDVVLIHSDGNDTAILGDSDNGDSETVETLKRLKQGGTIGAIGLSGKTAAGGIKALRDHDMDIAMITHNPVYQEEQSVIDTAAELGKGIFVKKAFASGHLEQLGNDPVQRTMDVIFANRQVALSVILGTINPQHLRDNIAAIEEALRTTPDQRDTDAPAV